jgi:hypothetical protein
MTARGLFRMVAALALVTAPVPGGPSLRGEDDTVVDAAAQRAQEQGQQQQQVVLDQQMSHMFFPVEGNAEKSRQQCLDRLLLQVSALDEICGLKAEQGRKCEAAAKLDVSRAMDEIETVRQRYSGRTVDLQNPAGQAEWQRFHQDAQAVQAKLQDVGGETSLLRKVIAGILDEEQRSDWRRESDLRAQYQWRSVVDAGMVQLDVTLGLTSEQHEAILGLLMEKPLRINQAKIWMHGNHFPLFVCWYGLSRLDQAKLKALVNERQWKMLGQFIEQGKGMKEHLKQQKMILE